MDKIISCILCERAAIYTIQPEGGKLAHYCMHHFDEVVAELEARND